MKKIRLTGKNGSDKFTTVDDDLFIPLSLWRWMYHPRGYAYRSEWNHGDKIQIFMHNEVLAYCAAKADLIRSSEILGTLKRK